MITLLVTSILLEPSNGKREGVDKDSFLDVLFKAINFKQRQTYSQFWKYIDTDVFNYSKISEITHNYSRNSDGCGLSKE